MEPIKKELFRFIVAGILAVATDFSSYFLLQHFFSIDVSKGISFILGSIVAFIINKLWTFENDEPVNKALLQFSILYCCTFFANVAVNHWVVISLQNIIYVKYIGFFFATATSTILNFLGMKFWVFSNKKNPS